MAATFISHRQQFEAQTLLPAVARAIDATLADAVRQAMQPGYVPVDTGILRGSLEFRRAERQGDTVSGSFGSYTVEYALFQEIGARGRPGRYYLRRAADVVFPSLPQRLARELRS